MQSLSMESLLVLFTRNTVYFLLFDRGHYLGKYLMDAKEKYAHL